jgi:hypothetical protein
VQRASRGRSAAPCPAAPAQQGGRTAPHRASPRFTLPAAPRPAPPPAGALLGLCLLAQAYEHAVDLINCFSSLPVGAEVLVQLDRLVQLLETPNFTYLRLQLLQPAK